MSNREAISRAKGLVDELMSVTPWQPTQLVSYLNERMDETFYCAGNKVYMQQEPDHLPAVLIVSCI